MRIITEKSYKYFLRGKSKIEEELGAFLVCSWFLLVFASPTQKAFVIFSSRESSVETERRVGVNLDSSRIQLYYHKIVAHNSNWCDSDPTRLIASEHVRNKLSLLQSFAQIYSHIA